MGRPEPEFSERETELFQQRPSRSFESEGILDRVGSKTESIANSRRIIENLQKLPPEQLTVGPDSLRRWHRGVFRRVQSPIVGRFRRPDDGPVGFGVPVVDVKSGVLKALWVSGHPPEHISEDLAEAFERYETRASNAVTPGAAGLLVAELQTAVITIHPFVDGNSRTTNILTQAALHRLGQPELVTIPRDWRLAAARSYAVRPDEHQTLEPLTQLITARITKQRGS